MVEEDIVSYKMPKYRIRKTIEDYNIRMIIMDAVGI